MEPRIQYAKTEDGVSIAYSTMGEGIPFVQVPAPFSHLQFEWQVTEFRTWYERRGAGQHLLGHAPGGCPFDTPKGRPGR